MNPRCAFPDEVLSVYGTCGRVCLAVVQRPDGLFQGFLDVLFYDDEEAVWYWNPISNDYTGLYATANELAREVRNWPGFEAP